LRWVDDDENSALAQLRSALCTCPALAGEIADIATIKGEKIEAPSTASRKRHAASPPLSDSVRHDPVRLEEIEDRLVTIERLKRKYGARPRPVLLQPLDVTRRSSISSSRTGSWRTESERRERRVTFPGGGRWRLRSRL